jgi:hypothetical protein
LAFSVAAELGIDSNEIREIFLAKIYELSNPSSSMGKMEDDFLCKLVHKSSSHSPAHLLLPSLPFYLLFLPYPSSLFPLPSPPPIIHPLFPLPSPPLPFSLLLPLSYVLTVSVDTYNSDDWQKLKAAVDVLKNPVLDDSVLLEASAIGQYLHTDYIYSQSNPSIANLTEEELEGGNGRHFGPFNQGAEDDSGSLPCRSRRASEGYIHAYRVQVSDPSESQGNHSSTSNHEGNMINNWVAGLPEYGRRSRSHTDPIKPLMVAHMETSPGSSPSKSKTLPNDMSVVGQYHEEERGEEAIGSEKDTQDSSSLTKGTATPKRVSLVNPDVSARSSESCSSDTRGSSSLQLPVTPNSKVVKIFMTRVQKGMCRFIVGMNIHRILSWPWPKQLCSPVYCFAYMSTPQAILALHTLKATPALHILDEHTYSGLYWRGF